MKVNIAHPDHFIPQGSSLRLPIVHNFILVTTSGCAFAVPVGAIFEPCVTSLLANTAASEPVLLKSPTSEMRSAPMMSKHLCSIYLQRNLCQ